MRPTLVRSHPTRVRMRTLSTWALTNTWIANPASLALAGAVLPARLPRKGAPPARKILRVPEERKPGGPVLRASGRTLPAVLGEPLSPFLVLLLLPYRFLDLSLRQLRHVFSLVFLSSLMYRD